MCGITGIIEAKSNLSLVKKMCAAQRHRGPDAQSVYHDGPFTMGFVRLAVIDLETGDQPIFNEDKSLGIMFNGEIYNFIELRAELEAAGHVFSTQTDTEVILHLFEEHGTAAFNRLNGYFAFALYDYREECLYLVRDQFGIKPLHYQFDTDAVRYGSEIKSILADPRVPRRLNFNALHQQLNLRYNQSLETMFAGIHRIPPAHFLKVTKDRKTELHRYYRLEYRIDLQTSEAEFRFEIRHRLKEAVRRQMISDVPVGFYLSGGIDSGSLVALGAELASGPVKTFTLGFNEPTDEFEEARKVAERYGTDHYELRMTPQPLELMETVIHHAEEPKINLIQGYMMSSFLKDHVTVALSGMGGDEIFMGYDIFRYIRPMQFLLNHTPKWVEKTIGRTASKMIYQLGNNLAPMSMDEYRRGLEMGTAIGNLMRYYLILRNAWDHQSAFYKQIYDPSRIRQVTHSTHDVFETLFDLGSADAMETIQWVEFHSKMVNDYLLTEDRMSMANHIEQRVPFLDKELVEYAFRIPVQYKMRGSTTKYLLRQAMQNDLPKRNLMKKKWGFTFNPVEQYQKDLRETALNVLSEERIRTDQLFNFDYVRHILDAPVHPRMRWHYNYIWLLIGFYTWKETFNVSIETDS